MALTNSRPLQMPALENEALHNSASPVFQPSSLRSSARSSCSESTSERDHALSTSDTSEGASDTRLTRKDVLALKRSATASPLTPTGAVSELSKLVPVTGQRPKPTKKDLFMDDDILLAIFVILYEKDPNQEGVTVKQLCDYLVDKHPDMAGASTKLSNLISAKLNAYVKKVEKGEKTLKYALSRQWSEGSPRRMVYVYRGVLAPDYKSHTQSMSSQRQDAKQTGKSTTSSSKKAHGLSNNATDANMDYSLTESKTSNQAKGTFSINNNSFTINSFGSDFNIPYAASPVTMRMMPNLAPNAFQDDQLSKAARDRRPKTSLSGPPSKKPNLQASPVVPPYITAAAAAPRLSKGVPKRNAASGELLNAAASSIQKLTAFPKQGEASCITDIALVPLAPTTTCPSWLQTIQSGFLLEDIESPEAVSLEDLDGLLG
ncbi:GDS1-like protein [Lachancea thermotolerans]